MFIVRQREGACGHYTMEPAPSARSEAFADMLLKDASAACGEFPAHSEADLKRSCRRRGEILVPDPAEFAGEPACRESLVSEELREEAAELISIAPLTDRQRACMQARLGGATIPEIAATIGFCERIAQSELRAGTQTVKGLVMTEERSPGLADRIAAVIWAMDRAACGVRRIMVEQEKQQACLQTIQAAMATQKLMTLVVERTKRFAAMFARDRRSP